MFDDLMIGFMFVRASRGRVKAMEFEFAARHLGGPVQYTGRPMGEAHAPHPINPAHFNRRLKILRDTLEELGLPENVRAHWIRNTEALRDQILSKSGEEACVPPGVSASADPAGSGTPGESGGTGT
jgi:truncated hemoglobin YjbI